MRPAPLAALLLAVACSTSERASTPAAAPPATPDWEVENPVRPLPPSPLGVAAEIADLVPRVTPEKVRLGRWLFYEKRMSADGSVSCATCHRPENAFSEPTPVSTGIHGQQGKRKSPTFLNAAWAMNPAFFWDGRAGTLEDHALGPVGNPIEMGNTVEAMIQTLGGIQAYSKYFQEAFGSPEITKERVAKAIADYERTRMSGNSPWDRWRAGDEAAVSDEVKKGHDLFFGKAECNLCHLGQNFTDSSFHNLGIGWDPKARKFADDILPRISFSMISRPESCETEVLRDGVLSKRDFGRRDRCGKKKR